MATYFTLSLKIPKARGRNYPDLIEKEIVSKQLKYLPRFRRQANRKTNFYLVFKNRNCLLTN